MGVLTIDAAVVERGAVPSSSSNWPWILPAPASCGCASTPVSLPLEKLVRRYPFAKIDEAVAASERGEVIKPVILMPGLNS